MPKFTKFTCLMRFITVLTSFVKGLMPKVCVWITSISVSLVKFSGSWFKLGRGAGEFAGVEVVVRVSVSQIPRLVWNFSRVEADSNWFGKVSRVDFCAGLPKSYARKRAIAGSIAKHPCTNDLK